MRLTQRLATSSGSVETAETSDGAVLLNLERGEYFGLNPVGAVVWDMLSEPHALDAIADALTRRYAVDRAKASEDAARMLVRMRDRGARGRRPALEGRRGQCFSAVQP